MGSDREAPRPATGSPPTASSAGAAGTPQGHRPAMSRAAGAEEPRSPRARPAEERQPSKHLPWPARGAGSSGRSPSSVLWPAGGERRRDPLLLGSSPPSRGLRGAGRGGRFEAGRGPPSPASRNRDPGALRETRRPPLPRPRGFCPPGAALLPPGPPWPQVPLASREAAEGGRPACPDQAPGELGGPRTQRRST